MGQTPGDVRDVMIEGESGILAKAHPRNKPVYEPSKRRLTWPNGARATTFSGANPDELRGPQHHKAWADELPAFKFARETWDNLQFGLRLGDNPQTIVTTTPKPSTLLREIQADPLTIMKTASSFANRENLAPNFFRAILRRYEGTRTGLQEIYAQDLDEAEGALWKRAYFRPVAWQDLPHMKRIVVGIDPAVSDNADSDETGIIAVGLGVNGYGYVLRDASGRMSPNAWGEKALRTFVQLGADMIVAEKNQGGDMVENTIRTVTIELEDGSMASGRSVPYLGVWAKRGKALRAQPVSALYEQGRVYHVPGLTDLEDQCATWVPGDGESPDRVDAVVYCLTELMVDGGEPGLRFLD